MEGTRTSFTLDPNFHLFHFINPRVYVSFCQMSQVKKRGRGLKVWLKWYNIKYKILISNPSTAKKIKIKKRI
jgi:hypothetical protein